ncbi:MAG: hypothetical protein JNL11_12970 [Bdellovibrionaceae bacterium]|nr:hypothetical protein [Pseudobdellovibrionaceae bacterium]
MILRLFSTIVACVLIAQVTIAETLAQKYSPEQISDLLRYNAARVPEFQRLWAWLNSEGRTDIAWTGSSSRGFIRWNLDQLKTHSIEEVKQLTMPPLVDFLPRGGNDIEFVSVPEDKDKIISLLPKEYEIDVVNNETFKKLIAKGGATISNITIHPAMITDPWNGLHDYMNGTLGFKSIDEKIFRNMEIIIKGDYSKTISALRFIRLTYDIPDLKPSPAAIAAIRDIAKYETDWDWNLARRGHGEMITEKFLKTHKGNVVNALKDLVYYNLLGILAHAGISLPVEGKNVTSLILDRSLSIDDFTVKQLREAAEIVGYRTGSAHYEFLKLITPKIKTTEEYMDAVRIYRHTFFEMTTATQHWVLDNTAVLRDLKPTKAQLLRIFDEANLTLSQQSKLSRAVGVRLPIRKRLALAMDSGIEVAPRLLDAIVNRVKTAFETRLFKHDEFENESEEETVEKPTTQVSAKGASCLGFYGISAK